MMSAACLLVLALQNPDFSRAMGHVSEGRYLEAHRLAESFEDERERAQVEVFLRLRAGDLAGALEASERGVEAAPDDLWLLERRAAIAVSLGAHEASLAAVEAYAAAVERAKLTEEPAALANWREEAARLEKSHAAQAAAVSRARITVGSSLLLLLGLLARLATRRRGA